MIKVEAHKAVGWKEHRTDAIKAPGFCLALLIALEGEIKAGPGFGISRAGAVARARIQRNLRPLVRVAIPGVSPTHPLAQRFQLFGDVVRKDCQRGRFFWY